MDTRAHHADWVKHIKKTVTASIEAQHAKTLTEQLRELKQLQSSLSKTLRTQFSAMLDPTYKPAWYHRQKDAWVAQSELVKELYRLCQFELTNEQDVKFFITNILKEVTPEKLSPLRNNPLRSIYYQLKAINNSLLDNDSSLLVNLKRQAMLFNIFLANYHQHDLFREVAANTLFQQPRSWLDSELNQLYQLERAKLIKESHEVNHHRLGDKHELDLINEAINYKENDDIFKLTYRDDEIKITAADLEAINQSLEKKLLQRSLYSHVPYEWRNHANKEFIFQELDKLQTKLLHLENITLQLWLLHAPEKNLDSKHVIAKAIKSETDFFGLKEVLDSLMAFKNEIKACDLAEISGLCKTWMPKILSPLEKVGTKRNDPEYSLYYRFNDTKADMQDDIKQFFAAATSLVSFNPVQVNLEASSAWQAKQIAMQKWANKIKEEEQKQSVRYYQGIELPQQPHRLREAFSRLANWISNLLKRDLEPTVFHQIEKPSESTNVRAHKRFKQKASNQASLCTTRNLVTDPIDTQIPAANVTRNDQPSMKSKWANTQAVRLFASTTANPEYLDRDDEQKVTAVAGFTNSK